MSLLIMHLLSIRTYVGRKSPTKAYAVGIGAFYHVKYFDIYCRISYHTYGNFKCWCSVTFARPIGPDETVKQPDITLIQFMLLNQLVPNTKKIKHKCNVP